MKWKHNVICNIPPCLASDDDDDGDEDGAADVDDDEEEDGAPQDFMMCANGGICNLHIVSRQLMPVDTCMRAQTRTCTR